MQADASAKERQGDAAVNLPGEPFPTIHHLVESAMEMARGHYDSANKMFQVVSSETERPELKRLAETLGFMCIKINANLLYASIMD